VTVYAPSASDSAPFWAPTTVIVANGMACPDFFSITRPVMLPFSTVCAGACA
jgi:hypothetical protein